MKFERTTGSKGTPLWLPILLAAMAIAAGSSSALAQATGDTAQVLMLTGRVSVEHTTTELWALSPGQTVTGGQVLVTGPDGYAQLELSDHSVIEVFPSSRVVFHPSHFNWKDLVDLYLGKIRLQIQHLTHDDTPYHVTSPTAVISIRGTVLDVEVTPTEETIVQVETGLVGVRHRLLPGKEVMVQTGQTLRVSASEPLSAAKGTSRLVVAARVAKVAGETLARMGGTGSIGGGKGAPKAGTTTTTAGGGTAPAGGTGTGSSAGANAPTPPSNGKGGDNTSPPGDVIK